jgi:hypothetical protein
MTTINRFSEYQFKNKPIRKELIAFEKRAFIQYARGSWWGGLILESGESLTLNRYASRPAACSNLTRDIAKYLGHSSLPLNESNLPWLRDLADHIVEEHNDFFRLGILNDIVAHPNGIELYYNDSEYSEVLDDFGFDQTLDSELYLDIVFSGIPEDTLRLIELGLQDVPDDYTLEISAEYKASNKSIFSFDYQEAKTWDFDKDQLIEMYGIEPNLQDLITTIIKEPISDWKEMLVNRSMKKLESLATSVKKNR